MSIINITTSNPITLDNLTLPSQFNSYILGYADAIDGNVNSTAYDTCPEYKLGAHDAIGDTLKANNIN